MWNTEMNGEEMLHVCKHQIKQFTVSADTEETLKTVFYYTSHLPVHKNMQYYLDK